MEKVWQGICKRVFIMAQQYTENKKWQKSIYIICSISLFKIAALQ